MTHKREQMADFGGELNFDTFMIMIIIFGKSF